MSNTGSTLVSIVSKSVLLVLHYHLKFGVRNASFIETNVGREVARDCYVEMAIKPFKVKQQKFKGGLYRTVKTQETILPIPHFPAITLNVWSTVCCGNREPAITEAM